MRIELRKRLFLNFGLTISLFGVIAALVGAILINRNTVNEAQRRVSLDLRSAWSVIQSEKEMLGLFVNVLGSGKRVLDAYADPASGANRAALEAVRLQCGIDFFSLTDPQGKVILRTLGPYQTGDFLSNEPIISQALKGKTVGGFVIVGPDWLRAEGGDLEERAFMEFKPTQKAKPRAKSTESAGMALVAATPVKDPRGNMLGRHLRRGPSQPGLFSG